MASHRNDPPWQFPKAVLTIISWPEAVSKLLKLPSSGPAPLEKFRDHRPWPQLEKLLPGRFKLRMLGMLLAFVAPLILITGALAESSEPDFSFDIRPILSKNCFACHGPDEAHREADLRLDERDSLIASGTVVPGAPEKSELLRRIASDDPSERMPPPESGHVVSAEEVDAIKRWIATGVKYSRHWSYEPIRAPIVPNVKREEWCRNEIDHFILARLEKEGLTPEQGADRFRLIRRVSLDLTGLPPTMDEVDAFVADDDPGAYERLVDRLLASPAYGEHWARKWLDLARYADTNGFEADRRRAVWPFRDWVINALNADMPFDQFTIEQIAGDLLPNPTQNQIIATAFHRNTLQNDEGGTDDEEFRTAAVVDRVNTTMQVWMGTTMACCQCHSHKYDPLSHREYYELYAFFNQTADADRPDQQPLLTTPSPEQTARKADLDRQLEASKAELAARLEALSSEFERWTAQLVRTDGAQTTTPAKDALPVPPDVRLAAELPVDSRSPEQVKLLTDHFASSEPELKTILDKRRDIERQLNEYAPDRMPIMKELAESERRTTRILNRGSYLDPGEEVSADTPEVFPPMPADQPRNRLGLARWLVSSNNPLTARVVANRQWEQLFGAGIVATSEDFGSQGMLPSHPQLLDWMAGELMEHGWSLKHLTKTIVMSATYRQSARATSRKLAHDPNNRLLCRGPRERLSAEQIRDQALAVSGLLSHKVGGPSVMPPQPEGVWQIVYNNEVWNTSSGEDRYRRGIYTFWRRSSPYPSAMALDATSRETCTIRRITTNTPIAAFALLNDPVYIEAALALAKTIVGQSDVDASARATYAFRQVLCRPPNEAEVQRLVALFESEQRHYLHDLDAAARLLSQGEVNDKPPSNAAQLAAWTVVSNVLLNLDETLNH